MRARRLSLIVFASQHLACFSIDQMYSRTGDARYRFIGVVVAFGWVICGPALNSEPCVRTAVKKSAHRVITRSGQDRSRIGA